MKLFTIILLSTLISYTTIAQTTIFFDDFSSDQGWTGYGSGGWERSNATSGGAASSGAANPSADHTATSDNYIIGTYINSSYPVNMSSTYWLTSPVIDCSNFSSVSLNFWSHSGCESSSWDHIYIQAFDGSSWQAVWSNGSSYSESSWTNLINDISAYADGNANFQIRFGMGTTDGSVTYKGWNIDDILIEGTQNCTPPTDPANPTASANACGDKDLSFTGTPAAGIDWYWQTSATGTDMSNSNNPYTVSASGTYYLRAYDASATCWSNGAGSITVTVEQAPVSPTINDTTICPGNVTLKAYGSSSCVVYNWYDAASGGNLLNTGSLYDVNLSTTTSFYVDAVNAGSFSVTPETTNSYVVDHLSASGDDRSGIAITQNYLYVVGDNNTARMDLPLTLLTATSLPVHDGLFSDLSTGDLWTLYDGTAEPVGTSLSGYNVTSLKQFDAGLNYNGTTLTLSSSFTVGDEGGIYAGKGFVIIQDGDTDNFYKIDLTTGQVTALGIVATPSRNYGENWATWGVAEYDGCNYYVLYTDATNDDIVRLDLTSGTESVAADLSNISDMASITVSPWENRWYFHHEYSGQFGGTNETCGYADATITSTSGGACASSRDEITVTVTPAATAPNISAFPSTIIAGDVSTLTANYAGGTLNWYDDDCEGNIFGTGNQIDVNPVLTHTYYAAVDNGSCVSECDTVTVIVAQPCQIEALADGESDTLNICSGDTVDIVGAGGCSYLMDNAFDDGTMGVGWESNASPDFSNPCPAPVDGTTYLWIGDAATFPRDLITQPYAVTEDCQVCFDFIMATQGNPTPCEGPDEMDEGVSLQWSVDDGATWNDITYFCPDGNEYATNSWVGSSASGGGTGTPFNVWDNYCYNVPAGAASETTKFRFHQEQVTSNIYDHWGIDNVEITCPTEGQTVQWNYGPTVLDPVADVTPGASTTYTVILDDGLGFGNADTASVYVHIIGTPDVTDDHACQAGDPVTLLASGQGTLEWYDDATAGNLVNTGTTYNIPSLAAPDSFYVAEVLPAFATITYTFDSDMEGWTASHTCAGSYDWSYNSDGGNGTLFASDPSSTSAQLVQSPSIDVSSWNGSLTLSYTHKYTTENCCDEGIVGYRLDGGVWQYFTPTGGSYNDVNNIDYNPLNGCTSNSLESYHGTQSSYVTHSGDIDVSSASTLEIAFVFTSDGSVGSTGWYIDEVSLAGGGTGACPISRAVVYADISDLHVDESISDVSCYGNNDGSVTALPVDAMGIPLSGIYSYNWNNSETTSTISNQFAGNYDVTVSDTYGCEASASVTIGGPAMPTSIASSSGTSGDCNIVSPDNWVHIVNSSNDDEIIASVFDAAGGNDLYSTEAEATIYATVQYHNSQPYLQRVVRVTPSVQGPAIVRIYFTDAEFTALQAADPSITSINDLGVTKCEEGGGEWDNCALMSGVNFAVSPLGTGYYAEVTVTSFSKFYIHKETGWALPVELTDFTAHCSDNGVTLNWSTSSEINNDYFVIERSDDMKNFEYVTEISGQGNSNKTQNYEYEDFTYDGKKAYYRLLQVDFDGTAKYHPSIVVNCNNEKEQFIKAYQIAEHKITVETKISEGNYILALTDNTGRLIINKKVSITEENQSFDIQNRSLIKGLYFVSLSDGINKYDQKVIIR